MKKHYSIEAQNPFNDASKWAVVEYKGRWATRIAINLTQEQARDVAIKLAIGEERYQESLERKELIN